MTAADPTGDVREQIARVGQVRQRYDVETTTQGAGLTQQAHLTGVTSEAWTGTEWVDVRELVAAQETVRRVEALAEELDGEAPQQEAWDGNVQSAYGDIANRIRAAVERHHEEGTGA